jgi:phosphoserine phosphatase
LSEWGWVVISGGAVSGLARRARVGLPGARGGVRIAAFDVDGTLIDGQLGWPLLRLLHESELVAPDRLAVVKRHLAALPGDGFEDPAVIWATYRLYGETLAGAPCAAVDRLLDDVWALQRGDLFGFVRPLVGELRDAGFVPLLISGGIHELVGRMAADLGIDHYRGMRLERGPDGVFTGRVAPSAGAAKHEVARALIGERSIRWSDSIAVGDALPDADLLDRVGHPYAFEPTPALAGRARAGGWTVCGRDTLRPLIRARVGVATEITSSAPAGSRISGVTTSASG